MQLDNFEPSVERVTVLIPRGGAELWECAREAIAYSFVQRTEVRFVHNGREFVVKNPTSNLLYSLCVQAGEKS